MHRNNIPFKVAAGYIAACIILATAVSLVYNNTKSILAINQASREYIKKREAADRTMSSLLKEEQTNLQQLSDAMKGRTKRNYLHDKVNSLNNGEDSVVVHPMTQQTHHAKSTTVEVMKTRKGFFKRLADAFKKEYAETLSVKVDSSHASVDTIVTPVNVADDIADILKHVEDKEKMSTDRQSKAVNREMEELQMVNAQLALRSTRQLNEMHQRDSKAMQQTVNMAMEARQHLLWQIGLLATIAIIATFILLWYIWRDYRRERIYKENLENANEEIKRIMQQRERLLLTITHDIKAPAASISGFIDLMKDYVNHPHGMEYLNSIKGAATHLSRLVASLLDYHQLERGMMKVQPTDFQPAVLVKQCVEGIRMQANEKGLNISYAINDDTEDNSKGLDAIYRADEFRIRQILDNLVSNAVKYTERGSISVNARITRNRNDSNAYVLTLTVSDTGKGMTVEETKEVFRAFTRLGNAQGTEGTGLGLSITHELVKLLDGTISVTSEPGKGSTFTVTLPLVHSTKKAEPLNAEKKHEAIDKESEHTLLILDDDKLQLKLLQEMLHKLTDSSWHVIACNHITEALTALHNKRPDIMLMDVEMPEMNGLDLIGHINHTGMKVIAMTAHDHSIMADLKKAGFDDCLFKPFRTEALARVLGISDPLLAFADNDEATAAALANTVRQGMEGYLADLTAAMNSSDDGIDIQGIEKTVHKLLPIAVMLHMPCIEELTALTPEHISELSTDEIRHNVQSVILRIQDALIVL